jgi:hypothetical protein
MGLGRCILIFGGIVYGEGRSCKASGLKFDAELYMLQLVAHDLIHVKKKPH